MEGVLVSGAHEILRINSENFRDQKFQTAELWFLVFSSILFVTSTAASKKEELLKKMKEQVSHSVAWKREARVGQPAEQWTVGFLILGGAAATAEGAEGPERSRQ